MENEIRTPYERLSLLMTTVIALFLSYFVFELSSTLLAFLLFVQLAYILSQQKQIQGNSIKITEKQFNNLHKIIKKHSEKLEIEIPDSFVTFDPTINAYVMGFKRPYTLVLTSALIEAMSEEEITFVIGHELGHIKLSHSLLKSLVTPLDQNLPIITFVFNYWLRKTEYSSDRAGLLLSGSPNNCISALLKMTVGSKLYKQLDTKEMVEQIEIAYDEKVERMSELFLTHPYVTNRIKHLIEFYNHIAKEEKKNKS